MHHSRGNTAQCLVRVAEADRRRQTAGQLAHVHAMQALQIGTLAATNAGTVTSTLLHQAVAEAEAETVNLGTRLTEQQEISVFDNEHILRIEQRAELAEQQLERRAEMAERQRDDLIAAPINTLLWMILLRLVYLTSRPAHLAMCLTSCIKASVLLLLLRFEIGASYLVAVCLMLGDLTLAVITSRRFFQALGVTALAIMVAIFTTPFPGSTELSCGRMAYRHTLDEGLAAGATVALSCSKSMLAKLQQDKCLYGGEGSEVVQYVVCYSTLYRGPGREPLGPLLFNKPTCQL